LYTSFQLSSRNTFICFPATMVTTATLKMLPALVPTLVQTGLDISNLRMTMSEMCFL
jgi:hypothetical protein